MQGGMHNTMHQQGMQGGVHQQPTSQLQAPLQQTLPPHQAIEPKPQQAPKLDRRKSFAPKMQPGQTMTDMDVLSQLMMFKPPEGKKMRPQEQLMLWCKTYTAGFANVKVSNFTKAWADGLAWAALISCFHPTALDFDSLKPGKENAMDNMTKAYNAAQGLGIEMFLDAEDTVSYQDRKSIITQLSEWRAALSVDYPIGMRKISADAVQVEKLRRARADRIVERANQRAAERLAERAAKKAAQASS